MTPKVAIVVPVYNAALYVEKAVEACLAQDYDSSALEIVFVDDGSIDGTGRLLGKYPITLLTKPNGGPASARNTGWRATHAEIVCFTHATCIPEAGWVRKLVALFDAPKVAGVGGSYDLLNPSSWLARGLHEETVDRHRLMPPDVYYLESLNAAYRRSVLEAVGGFPDGYRVADDAYVAYELVKRGYTLRFDANTRVARRYLDRLGPYLNQQHRQGYWWVMLYARHFHMLRGDHYHGWLDFMQPPFALLLLAVGMGSAAMEGLGSWFAALASIYVGMQIPRAMILTERGKFSDALRLIPITLARGMMRGLGMFGGFIACMLEWTKK